MPNPAERLLAPEHRDRLVADLVALIESQVASASGLSGLSLKTGLSMLKSSRPDILPRAMHRLLPDLAAILEPLQRKFDGARTGGDFSAFLEKNSAQLADAIMAQSDARVANATHPTVKSVFKRFRGAGEKQVRAAMPALARLLKKYL